MGKKVLLISKKTEATRKLARELSVAGYGITGIEGEEKKVAQKLKIEKPDLIALDVELAQDPKRLLFYLNLHKKSNIPIIALADLPPFSPKILDASGIAGIWSYHIDSLSLQNFSMASALSSSFQDTTAHYPKSIPFTPPTQFDIIGSSDAFMKVLDLAKKVAATDVTVLLTGESGTGKEVFAKYIHKMSLRNQKDMVALNCAAIPQTLLESELFGHEKGSFTGATEKRLGKFKRANNSTLFLDEVGELPLNAQSSLLRSIQEKEVESVGAAETTSVDVRFIAATNRSLSRMVDDGTFRADLFFRLNIFPIHLPPLRERKEDIIPLAEHFLHRFSKRIHKQMNGFSKACQERLLNYHWPGNIRELQHLIERAVIMADGNFVDMSKVEFSKEKPQTDFLLKHNNGSQTLTLEEIERQAIIEALRMCKGKIRGKDGAADLLKVHPNTLDFKIKKLNIEKKKLFS